MVSDGAPASGTGSREPDPQAVPALSGFDPSRTAWLHIRPQFTYHAEASVVGTTEGLLALQRAVSLALGEGQAEETVFASDGEGYRLTVRRSRTIKGLGDPAYLDELARNLALHERDYLVRESKLIRKRTDEAYAALRWCKANGNPHTASGMSAGTAETAQQAQGVARQPGGDSRDAQVIEISSKDQGNG